MRGGRGGHRPGSAGAAAAISLPSGAGIPALIRHGGSGAAYAAPGDEEGGRPLPSIALALAFGAIAVMSIVLGYIGLAVYLAGSREYSSRPLDLLYYDLQLFIINSPPVSRGGP